MRSLPFPERRAGPGPPGKAATRPERLSRRDGKKSILFQRIMGCLAWIDCRILCPATALLYRKTPLCEYHFKCRENISGRKASVLSSLDISNERYTCLNGT